LAIADRHAVVGFARIHNKVNRTVVILGFEGKSRDLTMFPVVILECFYRGSKFSVLWRSTCEFWRK